MEGRVLLRLRFGVVVGYLGMLSGHQTLSLGNAFAQTLPSCSSPTDGFYTVSPCRVLDTRLTNAPLAASEARIFSIAGLCGIPDDAAAIVGNLTVTNATAAGNMTVWPRNVLPRPVTTSIGYPAVAARSNNIVVKLGYGEVRIFNEQSQGSAHVILDVSGYFRPSPIVYDGEILGRANEYDAYPAHIFDTSAGRHRIWWCGYGSTESDAIFYSSKAGQLGPGGWTSPSEVFTQDQAGWTTRHTCDPSVVKSSFSYAGSSYSWALFYTGWWTSGCPPETTCLSGRNAIGVAYSNNGTSWTPYSNPVLKGDPSVITNYGAGQSGVAKGPDATDPWIHVYRDTTRFPYIVLNETTNGRIFTPVPPQPTNIAAGGRLGAAQAPDIAYNPANHRWYVAVQTTDPDGVGGGEARVLRATCADTLEGSWEVIAIFNSSVTGWPQNHNPGLGKTPEGRLYVDATGWAHVFVSTGNMRPDTESWQISQGRFRP